MAEQNGQLAAEYRDIKQRFSWQPHIQVQAVHGDPPNAYEIAYHLKGMHKDANGHVVIVDTHTVRIDLPDGYPMLAPSCKAVSPIFHPDFGPDAINTNDFWEKTPSLPDLITHIGRMIAFQFFSLEGVSNPEALEWAQANGDQLPMDDTDFTSLASKDMKQKQQTDKVSKKKTDEPQSLEDVPEASSETSKKAMAELSSWLLKFNLPKVQTPRSGWQTRIFVIILVVVGLAGAFGTFYMQNIWHFDGALQQWTTVGPLLEQGKFKEAEQELKSILTRLDKVRLVYQDPKLVLLNQINQVRSTEQFRNGLLGNVLLNDHYYSKQDLGTYHDIKNRLAKAEAFSGAGRWQKAVEEYVDASHKTILLGERAPVSGDLVRKALNHARLQEQITIGDHLKAEKKWISAETQFKKALQLLSEIRDSLDPLKAEKFEATLRTTVSELQGNIQEEAFAADMAQGDQFFSKKQWSQAVTNYENAMRMADRSGGKLAMQAKKTEKQLDIAKLYAMYDVGNVELKAGRWNEAIQHLEMSERLWNKVVAAGTEVMIGQGTIKRIILVAKIRREEAVASGYLVKKEYVHANEVLTAIISLIDQSGLVADREFAMAKNAAANRITENIFLKEIEEKKVYLVKNYQEIFIQYFPSSAHSDLSNPEISYVEKDDSYLYFLMRCKSIKRRLQSVLELNYRFNRKTGKWSTK